MELARQSVTICMPAYNESEGIAEFLREIEDELSAYQTKFIVVDDCSSDDTADVARASSSSIEVIRNNENLGHGPSTIRGLTHAFENDTPWVLSVDGDGQVLGADLRLILDVATAGGYDVVEGVRSTRDDPAYRRLASLMTRILVRARCGVVPADANTPVRCYRREALGALLSDLPHNVMTPNLFISSRTRSAGLRSEETLINWIPRRGSDQASVTWQSRTHVIPSRRFGKFCINATIQWVTKR